MKRSVTSLLFCLYSSTAFALCSSLDAYKENTASGVQADCESEAGECRWSFKLGDPGSRVLFKDLVESIETCHTLASKLHDAGVNHPDFYDAWVFEFPTGSLSVSLKDKSALQQTFVVLRRL